MREGFMNAIKISCFEKYSALCLTSALALATNLALGQTNELAISGHSVYQLASDWTTDTGKPIKLAQLRGKPQIAAMIFTTCRGACPLLVQQMREISQSLPDSIRTNVGYLLVTFDPERDTPAVLHAYRAARQLPENQWMLVRGRPEDVQELALVLGVKYRKDANGQFSHSNIITLLNAEGEIVFQQTRLNGSSGELAQKLSALLKR